MNRWEMSARLAALLPYVQGRDRILAAVRGRRVPSGLSGSCPIVRAPHGRSVELDVSRDGSLRDLYLTQWCRPALSPVFEVLLTPGDCVYDVGANVGIYTTLAARYVGSSGSVCAYEPSPIAYEWLLDVVAGDRSIQTRNYGLGRSTGERCLYSVDGASGLSTTVVQGVPARFAGEVVERQIRVVTIDEEALAFGERPSLIKVDVEGDELGVLAGAARTLAEFRPVVLWENPARMPGAAMLIVSYLTGLNYSTYSLSPKGVLPVERSGLSQNLLSLPAESALGRLDMLRHARFPTNQTL